MNQISSEDIASKAIVIETRLISIVSKPIKVVVVIIVVVVFVKKDCV